MLRPRTSRVPLSSTKIFALWAGLILSSVAALGQSFQGGIRGIVSDTGGGAIAGAKVTLMDQGTNTSRSTVTNPTGEFVFNAVNPATYQILVENPGFKRSERKGVVVATQEFITLDLKMEVGQVTESVMVTEEVPLLETSNASTGQVIDHQKLVDLPNLGRNPFMMSKIAQNVVPVGNPGYNRMQDQSGSSSISIAGGPVRGNNYLVDGVPITDSVNRAVIIPTLESVEEVKIQANTYDAEMGRTGGGVFNTYMKSGTNALHGSALGYMRQTDWLANTFFNNRSGLPRGDQPFRNYGGSLGGPVWIPKLYDGRNKTFWFIGGEAYRMTSSYGAEFSVPTQREINGDFSQSFTRTGSLLTIYDPSTGRLVNGSWVRDPFPGNIIPTNRLNPVGLAIARTFVAPTRAARFYGDPNYAASASLYDRADQLTGKFDHQVLSFWRASLSYLHYGSREPGENNFATVSSPNQWLLARKVDTTQFNNLLTINPTTVLTVRYGFNRFPNENSVRSLGFNLGSLGFSPNFVSAVQQQMFPVVNMQTVSGLGTNNRDYSVFHSNNFLIGASKFIGRHSVKTGFDYRRLMVDGISYGVASGSFDFNRTFTAQDPTGTNGGADLASLLLGVPAAGSANIGSQLGQFINYYAGYVHDDYRVSSKLTLNLGLRFEYETGLAGRNNNFIIGFDPAAASPLATNNGTKLTGALIYAGTAGYPTTTYNPSKKVSPRIGAAYQINDKTTLRGGYGIFWAPVPFSLQSPLGFTQDTQYQASNDGNRTAAGTLSDPFPNGLLQPVGKAAGLLTGVGRSVSALDMTAKSPIIHQYSFDVQRQLPGAITLAVGYVGSTARNLVLGTAGININQLDPKYFSLGAALNESVPNPYYQQGGVNLVGQATITRAQSLKPFPQFGNVTISNHDENKSQYHSMVVKAQKRMTNGLSFLSTWTWSQNMDSSVGGVGNFFTPSGAYQNAYNPEAEYSLSAFHTPHRWANTLTYELPFGRGKSFMANSRVLDYAVGGWSVNAVNVYQTGFPLAITQNDNLNSVAGASGQRPNATGVSPETSGNLMNRLDSYINPAAFSQAPQFTFGNVGRTISMRGPGQSNWDLSVFKSFTFSERLRAQFRAEALNAFNTPMFKAPNTAFGNASFGKITSQANFPRFIQLGVRFFF